MGFFDKIKNFLKKITPFSKKEAKVVLKDLLAKKENIQKDLKPGNICFYTYHPKDKAHYYDRKPLVLVLKVSGTHMLGLNFHWVKFNKRIDLIKYILKLNRKGDDFKIPLSFTYAQLKPFLLKKGYRDCLHCYIRTRIDTGVALPPSYLIEAAKLDLAVFKKG